MTIEAKQVETDSRFPSGTWVGFFLQPSLSSSRHQMDLALTFAGGVFHGEGRDSIGEFVIRGRYEVRSGDVSFHKQYLGRHSVFYKGCNEGKGIWGVWEMAMMGLTDRGGFHIWPKGMADPTRVRLEVEADVPVEAEARVLVDVAPP